LDRNQGTGFDGWRPSGGRKAFVKQRVVDDQILLGFGDGRVPDVPPKAADALVLPVYDRRALRIKRTIDVVVGAVALVLSFPVWMLIAALIKATSRGPVFFLQERVGRAGVPFTVIKFRTMRDGTHAEVLACEEQHAHYAANDFKLLPDDPRITKFGKILRKTSLDELPQLINVLRGQMSLVGIRPLLSDELARRDDFDQDCYKLMRPGMTGLWQVEGRSTIGSTDRVVLDRRYLETWSLIKDLKLLLATPLAILHLHHAH
jgi:lipopolysaccharide/colanic/teichoic acid biosynthesis glycosyltransferase